MKLTEESLRAVVEKEFKDINKKLADEATDHIAKEMVHMKTPEGFIKLVDYVNTMPKKERRLMVLRLLTGTMMFYSNFVASEQDKKKTKGMYS